MTSVHYPHSRSSLGQEEADACLSVLSAGTLAVGPELERLERAVAAYVGRRFGVATSNGTSAVHLALAARGVGPGDEVILPTSVCQGVLHAIEHAGATPVVADVTPRDFNLSAADALRRAGPKTKAVIVPHMFGVPSDADALERAGLPLLEDCAQAIGARRRGARVGALGFASVFSFYATKLIAAGDGGMVATDDEGLAERMRDLRYYGGKTTRAVRYNYKMQNLQAAIGLVQLGKLEVFLARRRAVAAIYDRLFSGARGVELMPASAGDEPACYRYLIRVRRDWAQLEQAARARGVQLGHGVLMPLHRYLGLDPAGYPNAERLCAGVFSVPIYPSLSDDDAADVAARVLAAIDETAAA